jgi:hypothetical protein
MKRMQRKCFICAVVALLMSILLFAGTKYASIYQNPRAGMIDFSGKKVAAFVIIPDEVFREGREETLAEELRSRGIDCVAGYTVLPGPLVKDRAKAKEFLNKAKISGAVLMRLVGDEERVTASAGAWYSQAYYPSFWGYWGYTWSAVYVPGYTWTDRVITLETAIYSIEKDQLLWAGRSESSNPKDIKKFVKDLCNAAGKELRKAGLVQK